MEDLGYNTSSALFALGTVALLTFIYMARVIFYALFALFDWCVYYKY